MSNEQDAVFVRNFSLVLVFLVVVGIVAFILAKIVSGNFLETQRNDVAVADRLAPIGSVNLEEPFVMGGSGDETEAVAVVAAETMVAAAPADAGKAAYGKICFACHDAGVAGAPKYGDTDAWTSRLEKGTGMLISNAINGYTGEMGMMPARGGMASLSDDEVAAAVEYMLVAIGQGGAAAPAEAAPSEAVVEVAVAAPAVSDGRGKEVYDAACFVCHATGVAGAPKLGDSAGWSPRIAQGAETMYTHSIKGFMGETGLMPPKGGRMDYSDDDVKAAVDYMVNESQ